MHLSGSAGWRSEIGVPAGSREGSVPECRLPCVLRAGRSQGALGVSCMEAQPPVNEGSTFGCPPEAPPPNTVMGGGARTSVSSCRGAQTFRHRMGSGPVSPGWVDLGFTLGGGAPAGCVCALWAVCTGWGSLVEAQ